jgi:outer membrane protein TolC
MKSECIQLFALRLPLGAALVALGACASLSPDAGFDGVQAIARERGMKQEARWLRSERDTGGAREEVKKLLASQLTADAAVQIALFANRALQATYSGLGIAEADLVQAGRLRNPGVSFSRLARGDSIEIERAFLFDVLGLLTMPIRTELERRRFEIAQNHVASEVLRVAADTRRAWIRAVAAQVSDAAAASAEFSRRMAAAGNFSRLDQARDEAFHAETAAQLARTRQAALAGRESLTRLMGLWGEDARFALPDRLPDLPKALPEIPDVEARAMARRLDVQAAMKEAETAAASLGLSRTTGFIDVIELGYQRNSESGLPRQTGYGIGLRLPLFDWGGARVARAESIYMQFANRAADVAVRARSEVREAYGAQRTAFDLARHYRDEIVPLRKRISEENLLRYNGMLVSVFDLLADARQQVAAVNAYLSALRDYWIAAAGLELAMTAGSPGPIALGDAQAAAIGGTAAGH